MSSVNTYPSHASLYPRLARAAYPGMPTVAALNQLRKFGSPIMTPLEPVAQLYDPATPMFKLNPALARAWARPARYRCFYGGRSSSKSHEVAGFAVYLAATSKTRFLCTRQFENKISTSSYALLKAKIEQSPWKADFRFTINSIINVKTGSEFLFYGIARNLDEIKSLEGIDIVWLEESGALTEEQFQTIEPTIRAQGSEIWIVFNPDSPDAFSYRNFVVNPPEDCVSTLVNWDSNPFLSETMKKVIADAYAKDPAQAAWLYGGQPRDGSDESVINRKYVLAAVDAHLKLGWNPSGSRVIGFDVADDGGDKNALVGRQGNCVCAVEGIRQRNPLGRFCAAKCRRSFAVESTKRASGHRCH
jgi:phage terminase large subunit